MRIGKPILFSFAVHTLVLLTAAVSVTQVVSHGRVFMVMLEDGLPFEDLRDKGGGKRQETGKPRSADTVKRTLPVNPPDDMSAKQAADSTPRHEAETARRSVDSSVPEAGSSPRKEAGPAPGLSGGALPGTSRHESEGVSFFSAKAEGLQGLHGAARGNDNLSTKIRELIERAKTYPALAKKRKQEGTVVTEFSINTQGLPENIRVVKSSGFSLLDAAARDTILKAAPFPPVRDRIEIPISFVLQ
jgi:TonB family protein